MQLKGFLLIGFVLNAFCLNNLNGGFLNPKYDLRKESLLESLKKDPSSFVELFAEADSDKISEVITLLEALKGEASSALETLVSHVTNAGNALDIANNNVVIAINNADDADNNQRTAQTRVDEVNTEHGRAEIVLADAQHDQQSADVAKGLADTNYAEQSPGFIDEQGVLRQAINLLAGLNGTHSPTAPLTATPTATPTASPTIQCYVELFEHGSYDGRKDTMTESGPVPVNDDISSLKVPVGCCVEIFENYNFQGTSARFCQNTDWVGDINDMTSSVRLFNGQ